MMSGVGQGGGGSGRKLSHAAVQGSVTTTFGLCDCETLYDVMQFNDWFDFGLQVQYFPHGPIHKLVGGVGGADYKTFMAANTANNVDLDLVSKWALLAEGTFKEMWRSGDVTCPTSCSSDAAPSECKCVCGDLEAWTENASTAKAKLVELIKAVFSNDEYTTDLAGNDVSVLILRALCNDDESLVPTYGDFLTAASPLDISFWPTHPFVERLLHWKRVKTGFGDTHWGPHGADANVTCYGHGRDDVLIWKNLFDRDDHYYTNGELYDIMDPAVPSAEDYQLPYVYDNFLWAHCEAMGYPTTLFHGEDDEDDGGGSSEAPEHYADDMNSGVGDDDDEQEAEEAEDDAEKKMGHDSDDADTVL